MFTKLHEDVILPAYETKGSAGADIRAFWAIDPDTPLRIYPGDVVRIPTGLTVNLPFGMEMQVRPRSGLAFKHGVTVLNAPGTIDSDFEHEIQICLVNHGKFAVDIKSGDRIAQLVYAEAKKIPGVKLKEVKREGGFGHTGRE
jgi:dUTP pyrophosphatase